MSEDPDISMVPSPGPPSPTQLPHYDPVSIDDPFEAPPPDQGAYDIGTETNQQQDLSDPDDL